MYDSAEKTMSRLFIVSALLVLGGGLSQVYMQLAFGTHVSDIMIVTIRNNPPSKFQQIQNINALHRMAKLIR